VRQDFGCFGEFGQKGYGYNVEALLGELSDILGLNQGLTAIVVGCGNLGHALLNNFEFEFCGMHVAAAFDADPQLIGQTINGVTVRDVRELPNFMQEAQPALAVLTVPASQSAEVAKQLVEGGIRGIWNFTQQEVIVEEPNIVVENVMLTDNLMALSYRIHEGMQQ
jgi:redox-sensing transcriptional repressor